MTPLKKYCGDKDMSFKSVLMENVKHRPILGKLYKKSGFFVMNILKIFVRPDPYLILFNSYGGKKFDDSTRAIYLEMLGDDRFKDYKMVWAFHSPNDFPEIPEKVQTDSLKYFITALKARCWISNSSIQRGIDFKGKETFSFNTWHGTPLKDMSLSENYDKVNRIMNSCDVILAQCKYEVDMFVKSWNISESKYKILGLPRNDVLAKYTKETKAVLRKKMRIPQDHLVVLYAPTFRDYLLDDKSRCMLEVPFDYQYWEQKFGDSLTFIIRMHYEVAKHNQLPDKDMWIDASDYPVLHELMIVSDILVSDYSSIMFDYSILGQPIINYLYDYDEYKQKRGLLLDIREELPWVDNSRELADMIFEMDKDYITERVALFRSKYVEQFGNATHLSVNCIYENIKNKSEC